MAERIRKTPIKEALAALETAWIYAQGQLDGMSSQEVLARMPGAVYHNSTHPFRDKLHIEGMIEGLEFALNGHSEAIEYWLQRAKSIEVGETQVVAEPPVVEPRIPFITTFVAGLVNGWFPMPRGNK